MPAGMGRTAGQTDGGVPVTEYPNRTPNRISESDSNERTNELTEKSDTDVYLPTAVDAGARSKDSIIRLADVIEGGFMPTKERHPVVRIGEREPIPAHVRAAVFYRDRQCRFCPRGNKLTGPWHLDHIVPWSAGGSDTTDNLRVLCERHNLERSNFVDHMDHPEQPATWWCHRCYAREGFDWDYETGIPWCPHHYLQSRCRVVAAYTRSHKEGYTGEWPLTWHERQPLTEFTKVAFCAHCNMPGLTSVTL